MILTNTRARPRHVSVSTKYVTAALDYSNSPFPSQLLWKVDAAQPSVFARQHLTNLLRDELRRTGAKNEFNLMRYFMSRLPRMLDELRAAKKIFQKIEN